MGNKLYEENDISAIATAIRNKLDSQDTYKVSQMAGAIGNIVKPSGSINIVVDDFQTTEDVTNYAQAVITDPLRYYCDVLPLYVPENNYISELEIPYDNTKTIESIIVIPIMINNKLNRTMSCCYYKYTEYPLNTVIKFHTFTTDTKYEGTDYYQEGSLVGSYIGDPVIDVENSTVTIAGRNSSYKWNGVGYYIVILTYKYTPPEPEEGTQEEIQEGGDS